MFLLLNPQNADPTIDSTEARTLNLLFRKKLWIALANPTLVVLEKQLQLPTIMLSPVIGERPS